MPIYDVENRFSYYKSYSDNIMFGPSKPNIGDTGWLRLVVGSEVDVSYEALAETSYGKFLFDLANPFFRSGETRILRLSSAAQTIEDSKVPDVVGLYLTGSYGSGSIVRMTSNSIIAGMEYPHALLFSRDQQSITGSNNQRVNNVEWNLSFPFEKKYFNVPRDRQNSSYDLPIKYGFSSAGSNLFLAVGSPSSFATVPNTNIILAETAIFNQFKIINFNLDCYSFFGIPLAIAPNIGFFSPLFSDPRSVYNFTFGINSKLILNFTLGLTGSNADYLTGSTIGYTAEGWKYGLYNGLPTKFSAVFRQNHYGQFRDMLEQRIYTKTYNDPAAGGPMDANGGINFISGSALAGESDDFLTQSIYKGSNVSEAYRVNPYGSGIFDIEYRASQPWFDNDIRLSASLAARGRR